MSKLTMKRGAAMLLALSIMLVAVPTIAITAIYAEGSTEVGELSISETTASSIDEAEPTTSAAEMTTAATGDTTTTAEISTSAVGDETTAEGETTTAASTENVFASADDTESTTTAALTEPSEAAEITDPAENIASGTCGECSWVIDADGVLTIEPTNGVRGVLDSGYNWGWSDFCLDITKAIVKPGVIGNNSIGTMFADLSNCTSIDARGLDTSNVTDMYGAFYYCSSLNKLDISNFDTSKVVNMSYMFISCSSLTELDVSSFNTSNVTDMSGMFFECSNLTTLDVSNFDTSSVINMEYTFSGCRNLTELDVSGFITSNTAIMHGMFSSCNSLTELDVSGFNTSNVTTMHAMFYDCNNLKQLNTSYFNTSNVTDMSYMFSSCYSLTGIDVSNFDTSNVTNMRSMFGGYKGSSKLDISGFDTSNVINMGEMFEGCSNLTELDISGWDTSNVSDMDLIFAGCNNIFELEVGTGWKPASNYTMSASTNAFNVVDGTLFYQPSNNYIVRSVTIHNGAEDIVVDLDTYSESYKNFTDDMTATIIFGSKLDEILEGLQIVMTTELSTGSTMSFSIVTDDTFYVDWGNGEIIEYSADGEYSVTGEVAGSEIKVYSAGNITGLHCTSNQLIGLNAENCNALTHLDCSSNNLTELDITNNIELVGLYCSNNNLTELNVTNNKKLKELYCTSNNLSELNITNNTALIELECAVNNLAALNISNNPELTWIDCASNKISEIDTTNNAALTYLRCGANNLSELDVMNNTALTFLDCSVNYLKFSTISNNVTSIDYADYSSQYDVVIPEKIFNGAILSSLSSEYDINGTKTVYAWYDAANGSAVTPTTSENGTFTFGKDFAGKTLYCEMTNAKFPELTLTTTEVTVEESFEVVDNNDYIGEAEPSDDIVVEDENGNEINLGNVRLIIGNVAENNKKTVREAIEAYNKEFKATDNNHAMYDIHLETDNGVKVEIVDGRIKIRLHYPDNLGAACTDYTYHLYHIKDDGTVEEIAIDAKPNGIWFYADDFSPYVLTFELSKVAGSSSGSGKQPDTGDNSLGTIIVVTLNLLLVMMLMSVLGFRVYQKIQPKPALLAAVANDTSDKPDSEVIIDNDEAGIE